MDDINGAAHAVHDYTTVTTHNLCKGAGDTSHKIYQDMNSVINKAVSDAKIIADEAISKMKKK